MIIIIVHARNGAGVSWYGFLRYVGEYPRKGSMQIIIFNIMWIVFISKTQLFIVITFLAHRLYQFTSGPDVNPL